MEKNFEVIKLFDLYGGLLTEKQREAVSLYYEYDLSLSEIGQNLNISRQAVKDSIDTSIKTLQQIDSRLNLSFIKSELTRALSNMDEAQSIIENIVKIL